MNFDNNNILSRVSRPARFLAWSFGLMATLMFGGGCSLLPFGHSARAKADNTLRPEIHEVRSNTQPDCIATENLGENALLQPVEVKKPEAAAQCTACACATSEQDGRSARAVAKPAMKSAAPTVAPAVAPTVIPVAVSSVKSAPVSVSAAVSAAAEDELQRLMDGNKRFVEGESENVYGTKPRSGGANAGADSRAIAPVRSVPRALVIACSDWDIVPDAAFDARPGELIVVRVAGDVIDDTVISRAKAVVQRHEIPLIIVLGHDSCGAVAAKLKLDGGADAAGESRPAGLSIHPGGGFAEEIRTHSDAIDRAVEANTDAAIAHLRRSAPAITARIAAGRLKVVGAFYDATNGQITLQDEPAADAAPSRASVSEPIIAATPQD